MREALSDAIRNLRAARAASLAAMPITAIVDVLDAVAALLESRMDAEIERVRSLDSQIEGASLPQASGLDGASIAGIRIGVEALAASLRRDAVWGLLEEELGDPEVLDRFRPRPGGGLRRAVGPAVVGFFFAGNTPLLAWPSLAASLLVKSAAFGKLSTGETRWPGVFQRAVAEVSPELGRCIALEAWPGGTSERDSALCAEVDAVAAYGSDETLAALRALTPEATPFHGFGHRVSLGLVLRGADMADAAAGLARDALLYDQQGCLSAAMVFVEGPAGDAERFAGHMARALALQAEEWRLPPRDPAGTARVRSARDAVLFAEGARVWGDPEFRWTVLLDPRADPRPAYGACLLPVHPLPDLGRLPRALASLRGHLQGAAVAAPPERVRAAAEALACAGVNRICAPGRMQAPPFSWNNEGRPVLADLVRWTDLELTDHVT